ncbi:MAG: deoxyribodipyrimidine photolyase [Candidatus Izimaplasma sp.]|nr:deoxyribodipyrimidine photolyase [Candidatus Izimaplasma bacterium]
MDRRIFTVIDSVNDKRKVIYFMTKAFRINNNYSLYFSYNYAKKNNFDFFIYIVEPYELNKRNLDYFYDMIIDLKEKLLKFAKEVNLVKRDVDLDIVLDNVNSIYIDKAYLKFDFEFLLKIKKLAYKNDNSLKEVESNVFVPIRIASDKEEYSARTIRKKIMSKLPDFKKQVLTDEIKTTAEEKAFAVLKDFKDNKLKAYDEHNDPSNDYTSGLSPYLKYGFISPVTIYDYLKPDSSENFNNFIEELVVRRELAYNYVYYNQNYDNFNYMTDDWAYKTMENHIEDKREYIYTKDDMINFNTHDEYFNAAMMEMIYLGRMHSYMRMYWCKKIIEWTNSYKDAFHIALELNNYYFYDGLTPNGYTGVAWCFGKHDRAWFERDIFGKLRYMNSNGLKRKFNIEKYVEKMNRIKEEKENGI